VDKVVQSPESYYVYFESIESTTQIVPKCEVYRLPCVLIT
jgi:hypothetical protein